MFRSDLGCENDHSHYGNDRSYSWLVHRIIVTISVYISNKNDVNKLNFDIFTSNIVIPHPESTNFCGKDLSGRFQ